MPVIKVVNLDRRKTASCVLNQHERNVFSQNGEDGILERIFEIIEPANRWCVEFGAWDGEHLSNTCNLIRNHGWSAVLIEANPERFEQLQRNFAGNDQVRAVQREIGFKARRDTIDDCLDQFDCPKDLDLISIDIDGNDYFIWKSMRRIRPRVVVIEYNPTVPNDVIFVQDRDMAINQGASLAAMIALGKRLGYELVAATTCNGIFVISELFPRFKIDDNSIDAMHKNVIGRIFHGYDGVIYNRMLPLYWTGNGHRPTHDQFQVLPQHERTFFDRVPDTQPPEDDD